ncbi:SDR family oxidoreductase [Nonomuraea rubra]|uniref:NAD(P)-dependent dehydrogenase (Short-subunit alcohol dehydrogenase family) n=2 Tax=Nonomuraea rubra TaxID=46180 RepID=A0A7X0NP54_9ACTN|nr:SDR family NAD(P)-dependent oxidoreductase [Nonomuraea rubra]MBB6546964.1 NAD(P)-dependent dehydrogenase (short-subunit alcohol dehydrogenase family) [Nonomuraea rubra]
MFITGGAQGIGLGMARAFARAGARLALADLDEERLQSAKRELAALTGDDSAVAVFPLNVRDREAFARVVDAAEDRLGPIAVLCNNAGLGFLTPITALRYEQWDHVLDVNLGGVINGVQTVLPRMLDRGGPGHIVNTASGAGLIATTNVTYVTSKFAVVGMSESLRIQPELIANGIGVTVVCPGLVRTNVTLNSARAEERQDQAAREGHAVLQRYGLDPDVVGEQVLEAVLANRLYVHTDRYVAPLIEERMRSLLEALPAETERDRELAPLLRARLAAQSERA